MNKFREVSTAYIYPVYSTRQAVVKAGLPDPGVFDPSKPVKMWATKDWDKEKKPTIVYKAIARVDSEDHKTTTAEFQEFAVSRLDAPKYNVPEDVSLGGDEAFFASYVLPPPCYPIQDYEYLGEVFGGGIVIFDRTQEELGPGGAGTAAFTLVEKQTLLDAAKVILGR